MTQINKDSIIDKKIHRFRLFSNIIWGVFMVLISINLISFYFFDGYLPLEYPRLSMYLLYGLLIVAILNQGYLYYLFKKIGKGKEFLHERGLVFTVSLIIILIGFFIVEFK